MLRKVNHTNVVRCLEVYRDDYDFRIVTELVEGENLKSFIDKQKAPLSQEVVMNIAEVRAPLYFSKFYQACAPYTPNTSSTATSSSPTSCTTGIKSRSSISA